MTQIILTEDQAKTLQGATAAVEIRNKRLSLVTKATSRVGTTEVTTSPGGNRRVQGFTKDIPIESLPPFPGAASRSKDRPNRQVPRTGPHESVQRR